MFITRAPEQTIYMALDYEIYGLSLYSRYMYLLATKVVTTSIMMVAQVIVSSICVHGCDTIKMLLCFATGETACKKISRDCVFLFSVLRDYEK